MRVDRRFLRTIRLWFIPLCLFAFGLYWFDWTYTTAIDRDPKWGYASRRAIFYGVWALVGGVWTLALSLIGRGRRSAIEATLVVGGRLATVWLFSFVATLVWMSRWKSIEKLVSSTTKVEQNNALTAIVIINQAATLLLVIDSAIQVLTAHPVSANVESQRPSPSAPLMMGE